MKELAEKLRILLYKVNYKGEREIVPTINKELEGGALISSKSTVSQRSDSGRASYHCMGGDHVLLLSGATKIFVRLGRLLGAMCVSVE